ncbi:MAG: tetratricopeptide (TPR) repeat protein [Saprospiraceae bacterium]|jgi:tetratricopeptide (TPR) repeat protein
MGSKAFRDKVRYYEDNRSYVGQLKYEERIDVDIDYALCLFEIGKYHKFLSKVDSLVEVVIMDNIYDYNGMNIYNDLLFKKAACLFNTGQYIKSERVLKAIVKLEPGNNLARTLYGKCKRKQVRDWHEATKAVAMVMLISAISIAFMELLIVRPFYNDYVATFSGLKVFFFVIGILSLIGNEVYLYYIIGKEIGYKFDLQEMKKRFLKSEVK